MFFMRKDKDKHLGDIKDAVGRDEPKKHSHAPHMPKLPAIDSLFDHKEHHKEVPMKRSSPQPIQPPMDSSPFELPGEVPMNPPRASPTTPPSTKGGSSDPGAPLFVKVDKYKDIITTIHELKLFLSGTKQLFSLLHEIDSVRSDAISILRATIQRLERSLVEMDSELLRPKGVDMIQQDHGEASHIESSLNDLQKQLMDLKRELNHLK